MTQRCILHLDGDGFFAGCEMAVNPKLKGRAVVVGAEKGIVTALSYEAKALGIARGMATFQIRKDFPEAVVLPGNYRLYRELSKRMNAIVSRYAHRVEPYSIDECFADITGIPERFGKTPESFGRMVQKVLLSELNVSFSMGIGSTKVRAKTASKLEKPFGCSVFELRKNQNSLMALPVGSLWGIGKSSAMALNALGIWTVGDFMAKERFFINNFFNKQVCELWSELKGESLYDISAKRESPQSVSHTRTFTPASGSLKTLCRELTCHAEAVAFRLRMQGLAAQEYSFFVKTKSFEYKTFKVSFVSPTHDDHEIVPEILRCLRNAIVPGGMYRATGVTALGVVPSIAVSGNMFAREVNSKALYGAFDRILRRYGSSAIMLASGMHPQRKAKKKFEELHFSIPCIGYVD
ncbi:MAG: DNA polymerase IV [Candidatus Paceibacterota bacterium]